MWVGYVKTISLCHVPYRDKCTAGIKILFSHFILQPAVKQLMMQIAPIVLHRNDLTHS